MPRKKEFIIEAIADAKDYGFVGEMIWQLPVSNLLMTRKGELVRCKDCKHRPVIDGEYKNGFSLEFPTYRCPCQCDDGYYSWMPKDDWYCANGEMKEQ